MIAFSKKPLFRLFLIVAFLIAQWSTSHIHLPEQHQHDGNHHLHELELHSAHIAPKLLDQGNSTLAAIDSHHPGDARIVYIDASFSPPKNVGRFSNKPSKTLVNIVQIRSPMAFARTALLYSTNTSYPNKPVLAGYPRAPPITS